MAQGSRARDMGIAIGTLQRGACNAITDVAGVKVGHVTLTEGDSVQTGVTAIVPHEANIFQQKVPAAITIANGFGKLTGYSQVRELGNLETPIILTNTLSVPVAADALIDYTLSFEGNKEVRSVNPVVGETNDGVLNDIRARHITKEHVRRAIAEAASGPVAEGNVGAGAGTICFNYKGGIGTASRILPEANGGYTVGVLVQTNYGGDLMIAGIPVGRQLALPPRQQPTADGSCMIVVATDAPLTSRNLKRLAERAMFGIARTGGHCSNASGEYVIAFSTAKQLRIPHKQSQPLMTHTELRNDRMTPLFEAVIEATEEAVVNSLFSAETVTKGGRTIHALPKDEVIRILKAHSVILQ